MTTHKIGFKEFASFPYGNDHTIHILKNGDFFGWLILDIDGQYLAHELSVQFNTIEDAGDDAQEYINNKYPEK